MRGPDLWGSRLVGKAAVRVRCCDHWGFRDGIVIREDSYWKLIEKPV